MRASETAPSIAKTMLVELPVICGETPLSTRTPRIVPLRSTTAMIALFTLAAAAARSRSALTSVGRQQVRGIGRVVAMHSGGDQGAARDRLPVARAERDMSHALFRGLRGVSSRAAQQHPPFKTAQAAERGRDRAGD